MKSLSKLQIGIVLFSVAVFVLLYFANKTSAGKAEGSNGAGAVRDMKAQPVSGAALSTFVDKKTNALSALLKTELTALSKASEADPKNTTLLDSIVAFWDRNSMPDIAAFYTEKIAVLKNTGDAWNKAGERYYFAVRFIKEQDEMGALYQQAMSCFEKGLKLDPKNNEAKIKYASCFVEASQTLGTDPMKGIGLLREVEKVDSNNINLQLAFAQFSTTSGQIDKAVMRLEKVIRIKPDYLEAYLYLADAYEQLGEKQKTIATLEKYAELVPDKGAKQEIRSYIDKLKNNK